MEMARKPVIPKLIIQRKAEKQRQELTVQNNRKPFCNIHETVNSSPDIIPQRKQVEKRAQIIRILSNVATENDTKQ